MERHVNAQRMMWIENHTCVQNFQAKRFVFLPVNNEATNVLKEKSPNKKSAKQWLKTPRREKDTRKRFEGTIQMHAILSNLKKEKCKTNNILCLSRLFLTNCRSTDEPFIVNENQHDYLHEGCTVVSISCHSLPRRET